MIEAATAFGAFDSLLAAIGLIRNGQKQRTDRVDQALMTLYAALIETEEYISDRDSGKRRNKKREMALAKLWQTASVPLRVIDADFAEICFEKRNYWMRSEAWDDARIERTGIAIDRVRKLTKKLLRK